MTPRRLALSALGFVGGVAATVAVFGYFGWVASLSQPVDWAVVLQLGLFFGPFIGVSLAAVPWLTESPR